MTVTQVGTAGLRHCPEEPLPEVARLQGFTQPLIDECPDVIEISPDGRGRHKFYSGQWYVKEPPSLSHYRMREDALSIGLNGDITTIARDFSGHGLPLLPGEKGFYVEFEAKISDPDSDHWPALWLMPAEHDRQKDDVYAGDSPGYERYMELDVDEGGFTNDMMGTVFSWEGVWPNYTNHRSPYQGAQRALDRTQFHTFAATFVPEKREVTWWLDGHFQARAGGDAISAAAVKQHFYLIMSAQTHGKNKLYEMLVRRVRVFVPSR